MPEKLAYQLYRFFWTGLDWLYPPRCGGCKVLGTRWCKKCASSVEIIHAPVCPVCGCSQESEYVCVNCRTEPPAWDALRSWVVYGGVIRNAIHQLKFEGDMALADALAVPLIQIFENLKWEIDLVIPVPLGASRMKERGYNQASLLALPLALNCGLVFAPQGLRKVKETPRQVDLSGAMRRQNLKGAFQADAVQVMGKTVLVIDDVTTTGATLDACSQALRTAGATKIFGLTLTRAIFTNN